MTLAGSSKTRKDDPQYSARLNFLYKLPILAVVFLAFIWSLIFAWMGTWPLALGQFFLALVCLYGWRLADRGHLSPALLMSQAVFFIMLVVLCLVYDVPSAEVPRVSHIFLLGVALVGYINYKRQRSRLQLAMIATSLATFVVFSSSAHALPFAEPIPDSIRVYGAWINSMIATGILATGTYVFQAEVRRDDQVVRDLEAALWSGDLRLYFQPQVSIDGTIIGAEALLRWQHAERGLVPPSEFIPIAEHAGLMGKIGYWVLQQACRTLADWQRHPETAELTLSVNVSASQFLEDEFEQSVLNLVSTFDIDATKLKIELTESVMVANTEQVVAKMHVLRAAGIGMALDDFGTGYSSLGYLRRLPLTQLKIDRSFVQDVTEGERNAALVRSIIQIGRDLDLTILAEGVETREQLQWLDDGGCDEYQGYLFGKPMPIEGFEAALSEQVRQAAG